MPSIWRWPPESVAARLGIAGSSTGKVCSTRSSCSAKWPPATNGADLEVLPHRHVGEDVRELRHDVHAQLRDRVGPQADQVVSRARSVAKDDRAAARRHQPVDRLEQRRFAGAVRPDHRDDGAARHVDRNAVQHVLVAVAADEVAHGEDGSRPFMRSPSLPRRPPACQRAFRGRRRSPARCAGSPRADRRR